MMEGPHTIISIIIPLYNKERFVGDAISSILDQDYSNFEIIVINDGSTDGSLEVVRSIQDPRIRVFSIKNSGPGATRNYGIGYAKGEWVMLLDADDKLLPGALMAFAVAIERWPKADMIAANFYISYGASRSLFRKDYRERCLSNPFRAWFYKQLMPCAGTFVCKTCVMKEYPYNQSLIRSEDAEMLFRLFREKTVVTIAPVVMEYQRANSCASVYYPAIEKDFKGHLVFDNKSLWEKICLYEYYIEAKNYYPDDAARLYPFLRKRYGLILAYHLAFWCRALFKK